MERIDLHRVTTVLSRIVEVEYQMELGSEFWWYFRKSFSSNKKSLLPNTVQRFVQELVDNFELARTDPSGKKILDAGCGFGINTVLIRLMGAAEVHGIDSSDAMINTFQKYLAHIPDLDEVYPIVRNVNQTGYADCFFDFVFCNEAISHYYDVPGFLHEVNRVLKPGGTLFISDANNGVNPYIAWRVRKIWERFENGPCGDVFYSKVDHPYLEKRTQLIRDTFHDFREDEIAALARGTFQYTRKLTLDACDQYRMSGKQPKNFFRRGRTPVDPENDNYQESLIYPRSLSRQLRQHNFKVKIYSYLGGAGGNPLVRLLNRVVIAASPLSWPLGRALKVVAVKQPYP
jgi:2-polyprenyl-3-methyl-5-hydroxy-6-metoxy-1,4-benzoquinol methylase